MNERARANIYRKGLIKLRIEKKMNERVTAKGGIMADTELAIALKSSRM